MNKQPYRRILAPVLISSILLITFSILSRLHAQNASNNPWYSGHYNNTQVINAGFAAKTDHKFFTRNTFKGQSSANANTTAGAVLIVGNSVGGQPNVFTGDSKHVQYSVSSFTGRTGNTPIKPLGDNFSNHEGAKQGGATYIIMGPSNQSFNISSPKYIYVYYNHGLESNTRLPVKISNIAINGGILQGSNFVLSSSGSESFVLDGDFSTKPGQRTGYYQGTVDIIIEYN